MPILKKKRNYGEVEHVQRRYETWMRSHERMSKTLLVMICVAALLLVSFLALLYHKPEPVYFATRVDGGVLPLVPLSTPFLTDGQVTNFAVEAVTHALTIDFANWRNDLLGASKYFEQPDGWNNFLDAMESSGMLNYIRDHRLVSTVVASGAVITGSSLSKGKKYTWEVQIPLVITYESASEISRDSLLAKLVVTRLPTWEAPDAVGVSRIVVRPGKS